MGVAQKISLDDRISVLKTVNNEACLRDQLVVGQSSGCHVSS